AGVVEVNDTLDRGNDAAEEVGESAAADENIVDFEKDAKAVALARQYLLVFLRGVEVKAVVDGDSDLAGDTQHKLELAVRDLMRHEAAEPHGTEAALGGGQRKNRDRADAVFAEAREELRIAAVVIRVIEHERLLCFPDEAGGSGLDRIFGTGGVLVNFLCF